MRAAPDEGSLGHVDDADEPLGRVNLRWVLTEEEEDVGAVGCGDAGVKIVRAGKGDVVGGESASCRVDSEHVVLDRLRCGV